MTTDAWGPPTEARLATALRTRWLGRPYEWLEACESTNDLLAARARAGGRTGTVIAADRQTAGRGRLGRVWHSPPGENLYVSLLLRPERPPSQIPPLTLLVGGAVAAALASLGASPRVKWPNDVQLIDGAGARRKVAGVLTEMASTGERVEHVVVGVGVNVNTTAFPDELASLATSVRGALGREIDRADVLAALLNTLEPLYDEFERRGPAVAVEAFERYAVLPDRCTVTVPGRPGGRMDGVALGVYPDGALRLRDDDGHIHRVVSGEIVPRESPT